jgi:hypothetical protein
VSEEETPHLFGLYLGNQEQSKKAVRRPWILAGGALATLMVIYLFFYQSYYGCVFRLHKGMQMDEVVSEIGSPYKVLHLYCYPSCSPYWQNNRQTLVYKKVGEVWVFLLDDGGKLYQSAVVERHDWGLRDSEIYYIGQGVTGLDLRGITSLCRSQSGGQERCYFVTTVHQF